MKKFFLIILFTWFSQKNATECPSNKCATCSKELKEYQELNKSYIGEIRKLVAQNLQLLKELEAMSSHLAEAQLAGMKEAVSAYKTTLDTIKKSLSGKC